VKSFDFLPSLPKLAEANCRDIENPNLFFPSSLREERINLPLARIICGACMNKTECLKFAIDEQIPYGIWAGTTPDERVPLWGNDNKPSGLPKVAYRIRALSKLGHSGKEIAVLLGSHRTYVTKVLDREKEARLKGEIQSQLKNEGSSERQS
jgi:WhiB family redox-sensing transcriptional regulator